MASTHERLIDDLQQNFRDRLHALISDTADTCRHGDLRSGEAVALIMTELISKVIWIAQGSNIPEHEFDVWLRYYWHRLNEDRARAKRMMGERP